MFKIHKLKIGEKGKNFQDLVRLYGTLKKLFLRHGESFDKFLFS